MWATLKRVWAVIGSGNEIFYATACSAIFVAFALYSKAQRDAGARAVLVGIYRDSLHVAEHRADSLAHVTRTDTVILHRLDRVYDTVRVTFDVGRIVDSLRALGVQHPETVHVSVPVHVLAAADSDVVACRLTVSDCMAEAASLRVALALAQKEAAVVAPSRWVPIETATTCGVAGAGLGALTYAVLRFLGK